MDTFAPILGMTMMVIGLLLFMVSVGRLLWALARSDAPDPPQERPPRRRLLLPRLVANQERPLMNKNWSNLLVPGVLFALLTLVLGGGVLVWLAPVPAEELTPAQNNLIYLGDTMVKGAMGAVLGFAVSRLAARRAARRPS